MHVKRSSAGRKHHAVLSMEDSVTTNEFYYLLLVLGAFAAFALGTSVATLQYKAWLHRQGTVPAAHSRNLDKVVGGSHSVDRFADAA
jgi:hypothetical protein